SWTTATGATAFEIQIDNNSDFSTPEQDSVAAALSYTASPLTDSTRYYWRVRGLAGNNSQAGPWSSPLWTVTIDRIRPATPNLSLPANNVNVTVPKPTFTWAAVTGATHYRLQVDDDPAFGSPQIDYTSPTALASYASQVTLPYDMTY